MDLLLLLMVLIWGANFSVVKFALRDFPELAFNACRLIVASIVFASAMWMKRDLPRDLPRRDWVRILVIGIIGTGFYQLGFLTGVKRTSVGNASLITGSSPVVIAMLTALVGHERIPPLRWAGIAMAMLGLYLVVGHGVDFSAESRLGDFLVIGSMICWSIYSVSARPLLDTYSPLMVTGISFMSGTTLYILVTLPLLMATEWSVISTASWTAMAVSGVLALSVSYLIWYSAIQRLGATRTSVYNYLTPIVAIVVAALWLREPVQGNQLLGAAAILAGLAVTRLAH
jgi:drug/metabolite transporter (DMT)-like permease